MSDLPKSTVASRLYKALITSLHTRTLQKFQSTNCASTPICRGARFTFITLTSWRCWKNWFNYMPRSLMN